MAKAVAEQHAIERQAAEVSVTCKKLLPTFQAII